MSTCSCFIVSHNSFIPLVLFPEQNGLKQLVQFLTKTILVLNCTWNVSTMPSNAHPQRQAGLYEDALEPIEQDTSWTYSRIDIFKFVWKKQPNYSSLYSINQPQENRIQTGFKFCKIDFCFLLESKIKPWH